MTDDMCKYNCGHKATTEFDGRPCCQECFEEETEDARLLEKYRDSHDLSLMAHAEALEKERDELLSLIDTKDKQLAEARNGGLKEAADLVIRDFHKYSGDYQASHAEYLAQAIFDLREQRNQVDNQHKDTVR